MNWTKKNLSTRINAHWDYKGHKMDWLSLEQLLVDILNSDELSPVDKEYMCKEAIDAVTKRAHFTAYNA